MKEVFKSIENYNGMYEVSNLGNVKSFQLGKERLLNPSIETAGYKVVNLSIGGKRKLHKVHQLVAMAFLNHVPNGHISVVNHIDIDKLNNTVDNLEIVSARKNSNQKHMKSSSKYTGVTWNKPNQKWTAQIKNKRELIYLGNYNSELLASNAYQLALMNIELFDGDKKAFRKGVKRILKNEFYSKVQLISQQ